MLNRDGGRIFIREKFSWSRELIHLLFSLKVVFSVAALFILFWLVVALINHINAYLYARNWSKKNGNGKVTQFFFLGDAGIKDILNIFDPDNFVKIKGDKIEFRDKVKFQDVITWIYKNLIFLLSFVWIMEARREVWKSAKRLQSRDKFFFAHLFLTGR